MRIGSYNIRKAVGLDWQRNPKRIIRVLEDLGAELVAIQEADKRLGSRPAVLPGELLYDRTGLRVLEVTNGPSSGWHGNAILVSDRWRVVDTERLMLPGIEPRGALIADLESDDAALTLVGTHLGLRRGCRQLQLSTIVDVLGSRVNQAVIAGDFNEWSPRVGFDILEPEFDVVSPGRTFHASRPVAPLDRFALGTGLRLRNSGVHEAGEAKRASDHLPVWAEIEPSA